MQSTPRYVADRCPQCGAALPVDADAAAIVICAYCGSRLIRTGAGHSGDASGNAWVPGLRFTSTVCRDTQGTGLEAFQLLIPAGWAFNGHITWVADNPGSPVYVAFTVHNPAGAEALEAFPTMPFYWTNNPTVHMMFPVGARYFGNEVRPPAPAREVLQELVLPRLRGNAAELRVTQVQDAPELADYVQSLRPVNDRSAFAEGAGLRLHYRDTMGRPIEENLIGVVEINRAQMPSLLGAVEHIFWQIGALFATRTLAGHLDEVSDLFQVILKSIRVNPEWYARCVQISQYMIQNQIQHIHNIGQLSRQISQMHNQISDELMSQYYQRQAVYDRVAAQFSESIRGVESYYDPHKGINVELPNTYRYAWANGLGEYILTDNPNFNPGIESTLHWTALEPASKT